MWLALALLLLPGVVHAQAGIPYLAEPAPEKGKAKSKGKAPKPAEAEAPPAETEVPPAPAAPAEPPPAPAALVTSGRPFSHFANLWQERRAALQKGDVAASDKLLEQIIESKEASGWPDITLFGEALVAEVTAALVAKDPARASALGLAATRLAPHLPGVHSAYARARWASEGGFGDAARGLWRAVAVSFSEPPLLRLRFGTVLVAIALALSAATACFVLFTVFRHLGSFTHDLAHLLPSGTTRLQATLVGITLLLVPIFLRVGLAWSVLAWVVLLGIYLELQERIGAVIILVLFGLLALGLPQVTAHFAYPGSRSQDIYRAARDASAEDAAARLSQRPRLGPEEMHVMALRARWSGDLATARDWLERALRAGADPELGILLGNIQYLSGDSEAAIKSYEHVLAKDPENFEALYDLSRAHYARADHQAAGQSYRKAMELDYSRADELQREAKRIGKSFIVDNPVPRSLLNVGLEYGRLHTLAVHQIWSFVGGKASRLAFALSCAGAALLVGLLAFARRGLRPSSSCPRCGLAACRRCNPEMSDQAQCGQCFHAFIQKTGIEPQVRIQKEIQAHRHRARRARLRQVLSLLVAGAAQMLRGSSLQGVVLMAGYLGSGLVLVTALGYLPELLATGTPRWLSLGLSGAGVLVFYGVALFDGMRRER